MSLDASDCMVCGSGLEALGRRGGGTYAWCRACGSVQLVPVPDPNELAAAYRSSYHEAGHYLGDPDAHLRERWRVCKQLGDVTRRWLPAGRGVVELGAGWGSLGVILAERGIPYVGFEPNPVLAGAASHRGVDVRIGDLSTLERDRPLQERLGVIALMSVYEHFARPSSELARLAAILPNDGALVVQVPTAGIPRTVGRWLRRLLPGRELPSFFGSLAPPWHVYLPTPRSLALQAEACRLQVREIQVSRSGRSPGARRLLQATNEVLGRGGHALFGPGWPFAMAHVFVLQRASPL